MPDEESVRPHWGGCDIWGGREEVKTNSNDVSFFLAMSPS